MRRFLVLGLIFFIAGGGTFAAWYFGALQLPFGLGKGDGTKVEEAKPELPPKSTFVQMEGLSIPVLTKDGVSHLVGVRFALDVKDNETAVLAKTHARRLADALMRDLMAGFGEERLIRDGQVDIDAVRSEAVRTLRALLGEDAVRDVLVQAVNIRAH